MLLCASTQYLPGCVGSSHTSACHTPHTQVARWQRRGTHKMGNDVNSNTTRHVIPQVSLQQRHTCQENEREVQVARGRSMMERWARAREGT